ncbi:hypothetical protein EJ04DRAFT_258308 [Polyplosphaeria fusca]|uniref:Uncharacterized protein n=1 Tax=Polyplosphaeria fusca TaxID=682080 RepID=A0A9P4QZF5_9PLEO|nr:hypothetical protein EJ04DRAFT_258308 [Polyplosphaeria fusca]
MASSPSVPSLASVRGAVASNGNCLANSFTARPSNSSALQAHFVSAYRQSHHAFAPGRLDRLRATDCLLQQGLNCQSRPAAVLGSG